MTKTNSKIPLMCRFGLLITALIIVILDQLTKWIARDHLTLFTQQYVNAVWNWTLAYNQGVAFSLFANLGGEITRVLFGMVATIVAIALVFYLLNYQYRLLVGIGVCCILGGAVGNLVDRIIFGQVTDFIQWHYHDYFWPAFNVADSAITVGVIILLIDSIFFAKNRSKA